MEYKLVAVDMDGTLLTPKLETSKDTVETIKLKSRYLGVEITIRAFNHLIECPLL